MSWKLLFENLVMCAKGTKTELIRRAGVVRDMGEINEAEYTEIVALINNSELSE